MISCCYTIKVIPYMFHSTTLIPVLADTEKMPILVLARLAKEKIPVWAPNFYARTGIKHAPYQYWPCPNRLNGPDLSHVGIPTTTKRGLSKSPPAPIASMDLIYPTKEFLLLPPPP